MNNFILFDWDTATGKGVIFDTCVVEFDKDTATQGVSALPEIIDIGRMTNTGQILYYAGNVEIHVTHAEIARAFGSAQAAAEKKWRDR